MVDKLENILGAAYFLEPARAIHQLKDGDLLAVVVDLDGGGQIIRATLLDDGATLPASLKVNPISGNITVNDASQLSAGLVSGLRIKTSNRVGEETYHTISLSIRADRESYFTLNAPKLISNYINNDVLVSFTDDDGYIVRAEASGNIPPGVAVNPISGTVYIEDTASLVAGVYFIHIETTDEDEGTTYHQNIPLILPANGTHSIINAPARNEDSYENGQALIAFSSPYGAIASAALINSTSLPTWASLNTSTGVITVTNASAVVAGSYSFDVLTTDAYGSTTNHIGVQIIINDDLESTWTAATLKPYYEYENNDPLGSFSDSDGIIVSASISGNVPAGVSINPTSGEIYVSNSAILVPGTYLVNVVTEDVTGGETSHSNISLVLAQDEQHTPSIASPKNEDAYSIGELLVSFSSPYGTITNASLLNSTSLPSWAELNTSTGQITVSNPSTVNSGSHLFDIRTTDSIGTITNHLGVSIIVIADEESTWIPETIKLVPNYLTNDTIGNFTDADGAIVNAVISGNVPPGVSINSTTGEIYVFNHTILAQGVYLINVTTTDEDGGETVHSNIPIILPENGYHTSSSQDPKNEDSYINGAPLVSFASPYGNIAGAILINSTSIPGWANLNATTGAITVSDQTNVVAGTYTFDVRTTDEHGATTDHIDVSFGILDDSESVWVPAPVKLVGEYLPGNPIGTFTDADGSSDVVAAELNSVLPPGLEMDLASGAISVFDNGALLQGVYYVDITTTDEEGGETVHTNIEIVLPDHNRHTYNVSPAQNEDSYTNGTLLVSFASPYPGNFTSAVLIDGTSLPDWATMNPISGDITVSNAEDVSGGSYQFNIKTTDVYGAFTDHINITILITADVESVWVPATIKVIPDYNNNDLIGSFTDSDGAIVSATMSGSVPGVAINTSNGQVFVDDKTQLVEGIYTVNITTIDTDGGSTTHTGITITIPENEQHTSTVQTAQNEDSYVSDEELVSFASPYGSITGAVLINATTLPGWVTLNATTGRISVTTPGSVTAGTYNFDLRTTDSIGTTTDHTALSFSITPDVEAIYTANDPIVKTAYTGGETLGTFSDADGALVDISHLDPPLPPGIDINPGSFTVFVDNAGELQEGLHPMTIRTIDNTGGQTIHNIQVLIPDNGRHTYTVNAPKNEDNYSNTDQLVSFSSPYPGAFVSAALINSTSLPSWATMNLTTGEVTVSNASNVVDGTFYFDVRTTDTYGAYTDHTNIPIVISADAESVWVPEALKPVANYNNNDLIGSFTDAQGSITAATMTGNVPAGVAINTSNGHVTVSDKTQLVGGTYIVNFTTTDNEGGKTTHTGITITLAQNEQHTPTVQNPQNEDSYVNNEELVSFSSPYGSITAAVLINSTALPGWATLNATTGQITVTTPGSVSAGTYNFDLRTTDSIGTTTDHVGLSFGITPDAEAIFTAADPQVLTSYSGNEVLGTFTDADGPLANINLIDAMPPPGIDIDPGNFTVIVSNAGELAEGTHTMNIRTEDVTGGETIHNIQILMPAHQRHTYNVNAPKNEDNYSNSDQLVSFSSPYPGAFVSAALINSTSLPSWASMNLTTGEVTVSNASNVVDGTFYFDVRTTDEYGAFTDHTNIPVVISADNESVWVPSALKPVDDYVNNDLIGSFTDDQGSITAASMTGNVPAGVAINTSNGQVYVSNNTQLVGGTYIVNFTTTDNVGGQTTHTGVTITLAQNEQHTSTIQSPQNEDSYISNEELVSFASPYGSIIGAVLINSTALPGWATLNATTGQITVTTPGSVTAGTYNFDIRTTDSIGTTTDHTALSFSITDDTEAIYTANDPIVKTAYTGGEILGVFSDADGALVSMALLDPPPPNGINIDESNFTVIVETAGALQEGTHSMHIRTIDFTGGVTEQIIQILIPDNGQHTYTVNAPKNEDNYSNTDQLVSFSSPYPGAFTSAALINSTSLPSWATMNVTTGEVTVSNAANVVDGTFYFDVRTTDVYGAITDHTNIPIVISADVESVWVPAALKPVADYNNNDLIGSFTDTDGVITSASMSGNIPAGVAINTSNGQVYVSNDSLLVGGDYIVNITTTDATGGTTTHTGITITLAANEQHTSTVQAAQNEDSYVNNEELVSFASPYGSITTAALINSTTLPGWVTLNATTGQITVNAPGSVTAGTYNFDIRTTDSIGTTTDHTSLSFGINDDVEAIYTPQTPVVKTAYTGGEVLGTFSDADAALVGMVHLDPPPPPGININESNYTVIVSDAGALQEGTHSMNIRTVDATGGVTDQVIQILIPDHGQHTYSVNTAKNEDNYDNGNQLVSFSTPYPEPITSAAFINGTSLPGWATLNTTTGEITVTNAPAVTAGIYAVDIRTTDTYGAITDHTEINIVVNDDVESVWVPATIKVIPDYNNNDLIGSFTDSDGAIVSASMTGSIPGVSINTSNGQVYVSDNTQLVEGIYSVNITTTDADGGTTTHTGISITIPEDEQHTSTVQAAQNEDSYVNNEELVSFASPYGSITTAALINSTTLPGWVTLNLTSGQITVNAPASVTGGTYNFDIRTTDSIGTTTDHISLSFSITADVEAVYNANDPQVLTSYTNGAILGTFTDADGALTSISHLDPPAPAGIGLDTGNFRIVVSEASSLTEGTHNMSIRTEDATGGETIHNISILMPAHQRHTYSVNAPKNEDNYSNSDQLVSFSSPYPGAFVSAVLINSTSLPSWATMNLTTGEVTVSNASNVVDGTFYFDVRTTDEYGAFTDHTNIPIVISADNESVWVPTALKPVDDYVNNDLIGSFTDDQGSIVAATMTGNVPAGVAINTSNGQVYVSNSTQLVGGTYIVNFTTTDNAGGQTTHTGVSITLAQNEQHTPTVQAAQNEDSYINNEELVSFSSPYGSIATAALINSTSLPGWVTLNLTTGQITVNTSGSVTAGTYNFDIRTTDSIGTTTDHIGLSFTITDDAESVWVPAALKPIDQYVNNDLIGSFTDSDSAITAASMTGSVPGVSINTSNGELFVSNNSALVGGSYSVNITTTDATGGSTAHTGISITIAQHEQHTSTVQSAQNEDSYVNGEELVAFSSPYGSISTAALINSTSLPGWVTLNLTTGQITVNAPGSVVAGSYDFDIRTTDSIGTTTDHIGLSFTIADDVESAWVPAALKPVDQYANNDLIGSFTDSDGAITSASMTGSIPGVSINTSNGQVYVSNNSSLVGGSYSVDITTTDTSGGSTTHTGISITIAQHEQHTSTVQAAQNEDSYVNGEELVSFASPYGSITGAILINSTTLPGWVTLNTTTGQITVNTPGSVTAGTYNFDIRTTDSIGTTTDHTSMSFSIADDVEAVYNANATQVLTSYNNGDILGTFTDADGALASISHLDPPAPAGIGLDTGNFRIVVSEASALTEGTHNMTIRTEDVTGGETIHNISILMPAHQQHTYTVDPPKNEDNYSNGNQLVSFSSPYPGAFTTAVLINGTSLPSWATMNGTNGQVTVSNAANVVDGTFYFDVRTTDTYGAFTDHTNIPIVISADNESVWVPTALKPVDDYVNNDLIGSFTDDQGSITAASMTGNVPAGVAINTSNGQVYVSNSTQLVGGTYIVNFTTTDNAGGQTTHTGVSITLAQNEQHTSSIASPKNEDSYTNSFVLASFTSPYGIITAAAFINSTSLPSWMSLNTTTGQITISNSSQVVAGNHVCDIRTTDSIGTTTDHDNLTIVIADDAEAVYNAQPPLVKTAYTGGETLGTFTDADGSLVGMVLLDPPPPNGININESTYTVFVENAGALQEGTHNMHIRTTDADGGITDQIISILIPDNNMHTYSIASAQNEDNYSNGFTLVSFSSPYPGAFTNAELINGTTLPGWVALNGVNGTITVSNANLVTAGNYAFQIRTTDVYGAITEHTDLSFTINDDQEASWSANATKDLNQYVNNDILGTISDADQPAGALVIEPSGFAWGTVGIDVDSQNRIYVTDESTYQGYIGQPGNLSGGVYTIHLNVDVTDNIGGTTSPLTLILQANEVVTGLSTEKSYYLYNQGYLNTTRDLSGAIGSSQSFSATFLVRKLAGGEDQRLFSNLDESGFGISGGFTDAGLMWFLFANETGLWDVRSEFENTDEYWQLVTFTYDHTQGVSGMKIYANATLQSVTIDDASLTGPVQNTSPVHLAQNTDSNNRFRGAMCYAAFYNKELSSTEVSDLYDGGAFSNSPSSISGIRAFYKFDGDTFGGPDFTIVDETGNGNGISSSMVELDLVTLFPASMVSISSTIASWWNPNGRYNEAGDEVNPWYNQASSLLGAKATQPVPPSQPVWIADSIAEGNHGLSFNGEDSFLEVGAFSAIEYSSNSPFTIAFWMVNDPGTPKGAIFSVLEEGTLAGYEVTSEGGIIRFFMRDTEGNTIQVATNQPYGTTNGVFVVVRYDGSGEASGVDISVDESSVAITPELANTLSGAAAPEAGPKYIGYNLNEEYFTGKIGHLFVISGVLSATDETTLRAIK